MGAGCLIISIPFFMITERIEILLLGLSGLNLLWLTGLSTQNKKEFDLVQKEIVLINAALFKTRKDSASPDR